eukprot:CAMPEP_0172504818 /NCGR_PEP_ID=MMETSP1066-20121228/181618_1 /TAXON_ID=671091 /ORGANISM="Coscinodiscus wailesii, Strain CCMP2513" /LENGTH=148 /DNA_ID=CAMNT_0013281173 /DNA_START=307 /DNA_END=753 /DNA_ORIENTATION=+
MLAKIISVTGAALTLPTAAANAKEPITAEDIRVAFSAVRSELESSSGGISVLEAAVSKREWENVKEFTKYYDLEFRKAKMGRAKKMMSDKKMKEDATMLCNAVTFDLIGINKAARVEDFDSAEKYLKELKDDISSFLAFEEKVVAPAP